MRPPLHLGERRVSNEEPEEIAMSEASRAHFHDLNLAFCAALRRGLNGSNELPKVLELIDGGMGPPSAKIEPQVAAPAELNVAKMDRQARDSTGKYARSRRKYTRKVV
jgi:hypothetical protein